LIPPPPPPNRNPLPELPHRGVIEQLRGTPLSAASLRHLYTAQEWDADIGLFYYDNRWYDSASGLFLSADPIEDDQNNTYRYVGNSPTNATDPTGLEEVYVYRDGTVTWMMEYKSTHKDYQQFVLGDLDPTDKNYMILQERWGGGRVRVDKLQSLARKFWIAFPTTSMPWLSDSRQRREIRFILDVARRGGDLAASDSTGYGAAFIAGLGTGGKALVNTIASEGWAIVTLGFGDDVEVFKVTQADLDRGYAISAGGMRIAVSVLAGAGASKLAKAPGTAGKIGHRLAQADTVQNVVTGARATYDIAKNGANRDNLFQLGASLAGVGVNALGRYGRGTRGVTEATEDAAEAAGKARSGVDLELNYKPGWNEAQRAAARKKVQALTDADTVVTKNPQRLGTSAASRYRRAGNTVPAGHDVDHVVDLQLNGADDILNMNPLDSSVNRSLGSQIQHRIKVLPEGTRVNRVGIRDGSGGG